MECQFINSYEELKEFSSAWDDLVRKSECTSFFSTAGFTRAWWRAYANSRDMHIAVVKDNNGSPRLIAPFQSEKSNPLRWESVGTNLINYNPFIVQRDDHEALTYFCDWLKRRSDWKKLVLRTPGNATLPRFFKLPYRASLNAFQKLHCWLRLGTFFVELDVRRDHPYVNRQSLEQMTAILQKKSYKWKINVLSRQGVPAYQTTTDPAEIQRHFDHFCELHITEWLARSRKSQLVNPETRNFYRYVIEELAAYQILRLDMFNLNDKPIAYALAAKWNNCLASWIVCFDLEHERSSPGKLLQSNVIQSLINEDISEFDFGRGLQSHKLEYPCEVRDTVIISIHPSPIDAFVTKLKRHTIARRAAI
ncbi:MAG TPA: GNAT family N-acetyltransferase [Acidobacteriota bacterium]